MPYFIDEGGYGRQLRTDFTPRVPFTYRRRGILASMLLAIGNWITDRRIARARRRRDLFPQEIPNWLREDLGLPPLPPRIRLWWEDL